MSESVKPHVCRLRSSSKIYARIYLAMRFIPFISAALVVLSCQSRPVTAAKLNETTLREQREINHNRIAVCLAGETRTFYYPGVHKSILKRAIKPLQNERYKVDVFFVIRASNDTQSAYRKQLVEKAIQLFNATKVVEYTGFENMRNNFEPKRSFERERVFYRPPTWCKGKEQFVIDFSHALYRTQHCLDVISEHEQEHKFYYDWIYRLRPDIALMGDDVPTPRTLSDNVLHTSAWSALFDRYVRGQLEENHMNDPAVFVWSNNQAEQWGVGDQFFAASRKVAQVAFNAFDISNDCSVYEPNTRNSEASLLLYLAKTVVPYAPMSVLWEIIRDVPDPSCNSMRFIPIPNTTLEGRTQRCRRFWDKNADDLPK